MSAHLDDILEDLALGTLSGPAAVEAEAHLASCPACQGQLAPLRQAAATLSAGQEAPPASALTRLMGEVAGPRRFSHFAAQVADLFDLTVEKAHALLESIDQQDLWMPGPADGVWIAPVEAGPRRQNALCALAKIPAGFAMPEHDHIGAERMFVLQGGFREAGGGLEVWRGEALDRPPGSSHELIALDGPDCIAASVLDVDNPS